MGPAATPLHYTHQPQTEQCHPLCLVLQYPRACAGGWSSLSQPVFSRAVSAVGTERGGMYKHHGRSLQKETRAALATERRFPATSSSTGCALIRDHDCAHCSSVRLRQTTVSSLVIPHRQLYYNLKALPYETHYSLFVNVRLCTYMSCHVVKVREGYALLKVTRDTNF